MKHNTTVRENIIISILSVVTVAIGILITFIETVILVNHGAELNEAIVSSLYSGFLLWIILAATIILPVAINKLMK